MKETDTPRRIDERFAHLSPLKRAFLALQEAQARIEKLEQARHEGLAVIGLGCRFPGGAGDPEAFWRLLRDGVDAVTEVPPDRWDRDALYDADPEAAGKTYSRHGAFLEKVDHFDAAFFGISPREAAAMDPQQRLLLEVGWEALENAGYAASALAESATGVFVGMMTDDYGEIGGSLTDLRAIDAYTGTGLESCFAAGRLSYALGLQGPSMTVETACSSSLVAIHLACRSLRGGESDLALAGGVGLILSPSMHVVTSKLRAMAADGRCRSFDAAASGYGRGEGCALVVLKRLSDALADGDRVLAVVRGSAVNHDGPSGGLTVPNGKAQQAVIRQALRDAGVAPAEVGYVEAHGTGTPLGDPIELRALGAVLSEGRPEDRRFHVGSVKTNIGHLEGAAGVAGLIKVVLALQHQEIPPHLHFERLNPRISWAEIPAAIATERTPWPMAEARRVAGVSSFGMSGTNAHVVVEEAPRPEAGRPALKRPWHVLALSAKDEPALTDLAASYGKALATLPDEQLADACFTASTGRTAWRHRLAVVADSTAVAGERLAAAHGGTGPAVRRGLAPADRRPKVAFLFSGQGSRQTGRGAELFAGEPVFRRTIEQCDELVGERLGPSLASVLYPQSGSDREAAAALADDTAYVQAGLFALQMALVSLWRSWGIEPAAVLGHSVGEYAAACAAGCFSIEDGLRLVTERGLRMRALPREGAMLAVFAGSEAVAERLPEGDIAIAAINSPRETVISGPREAVETARLELEKEGLKSRPLPMSLAFHSPAVEPMLDGFERVAAEIDYAPPGIDLVSNLTGRRVEPGELDAAYWRAHARQPVRFAAGIETLRAGGCSLFLEIGPEATLLAAGRRCLPGESGPWLPSLRRGKEDYPQILDSLAALWVCGAEVDWRGFDAPFHRTRIALPTYPFRGQRYWLAPANGRPAAAAPAAEPPLHPLLGRRLRSPLGLYESRLDVAALPYLAEHRVRGSAVLPAAAFLEMARAAGADLHGPRTRVHGVALCQGLDPEKGSTLQLVTLPARDGATPFQICSLADDAGGDWTLHAEGELRGEPKEPVAEGWDLSEIRRRCSEEQLVEEHYRRLGERGIDYGGSFRGLVELWWGEGEALGRLELPANLAAESGDYGMHPALLDAGLQVLGSLLAAKGEGGETLVPVAVESVTFLGPAEARLWCHATSRSGGDGEPLIGDLRIFDDAGGPVVTLTGLRAERLSQALRPAAAEDLIYDLAWLPHTRLELADPATVPEGVAIAALAAAVEPRVKGLVAESGLTSYDRVERGLAAASLAFVRQALRELGLDLRPGDGLTGAAVARELGVVPQHHRLLGRLLDMLEGVELVRLDGGSWKVRRPLQAADPGAWQAAAEIDTAYAAEVALVGRCGSRLAEVLRGACDPLELLFPGGSTADTEALYRDSPISQVFNGLVRETVAELRRRLSADRPLRVLEIGAGTGATTGRVLEVLEPGAVEYVFSDVSPAFLARAESELGHHPGVRFRTLDVERDPTEQGFAPHAFDLILAANVLHATRDLRRTLAHVRRLLAGRGILVLVEGSRPRRWVDLVFGLTEGWWSFTDSDLRPSHPLLTAGAWQRLLAAEGFTESLVLPREAAEAPEGTVESFWADQALVLARGPALDPAVTAPRGPRTEAEGRWWILDDGKGFGHALALRLEALGEVVTLDPADVESLRRRLDEWAESEGPSWRGVVSLWGLDVAPPDGAEALAEDQRRLCGATLELVKALAARRAGPPPRLWLVTRGAQAVGGREPAGFAAASLWGLGRVIALEHPELWGGLVDVDPGAGEGAAASRLEQEIRHGRPGDQVAWRDGRRWVARLLRGGAAPAGDVELRSDATYLIVGGLGGLGLAVGRFLVERGARHLVLAGRRGPAAAPPRQIGELEALGARVVILGFDVSSGEQTARVLADLRRSLPPLRGIVHAAGLLRDGVLTRQTWERFAEVMAPKVEGGWNLHRESLVDPLDFFILFSSSAAVLGSVGQANHAAANAFLDGLAGYRRSRGLPALSINWGAWSEVGSVARREVGERLAEQGIGTLTTRQGLDAFQRVLGSGRAQVVVTPVRWPKLLARRTAAGKPSPLLEWVAREAGNVEPSSSEAPRSRLDEELRRASPLDARALLARNVEELVRRILGLEASRPLPSTQGFFDLGFDSLMSIELKNALQSLLRLTLPSTLVMNYPTVEALTGFLAAELGLETAGKPADEPPSVDEPAEELSDVLAEVSTLSEDEALRALSGGS